MKLTKELFFSSNLIHQILDHTNDGINVVDTDGILVYVNNISANYVNQKRENMIGKHISQFYPAAVLLTVLENHRPILDKKIHLVPPNKYIVNSYPIFMDGEFMGAYSVFQDIQEIDQLNSKIKHLEMQVSLTKPEADFQHVVHMGTMQNIYKQAKKIVGSLGGPRHSIITGESGTGKTMLAPNRLASLAKTRHLSKSTAPSSRTRTLPPWKFSALWKAPTPVPKRKRGCSSRQTAASSFWMKPTPSKIIKTFY